MHALALSSQIERKGQQPYAELQVVKAITASKNWGDTSAQALSEHDAPRLLLGLRMTAMCGGNYEGERCTDGPSQA